MPCRNASFIGFTGTPIEMADANTRAVFGDYISVYDIQRAVIDGATVPIYYESRLAKLELKESERPKIDPNFEEATEGEEVERKEKLKPVGAARGHGRVGEPAQAHRPRPGGPLRESPGRPGRQGDGRLHEPAHLRGALPARSWHCGRVGIPMTTSRAPSRW